MQAAALYAYSSDAGEPLPVESTFQVIFMAGWTPHSQQPQACKRGSATASMKDIPGAVEPSRGSGKT
jgi:hypothetical protein